MLKLIHRAGSCENGPCPNAFDVTGGGREDWAAVQGTTVGGTSAPSRWSAVMVPRQLVIEYASLIRDAVPPGAAPQPPGTFGVADDGPERAVISGETMTDPAALAQLSGMPAHESVVLIPRRLIAEYASQR